MKTEKSKIHSSKEVIKQITANELDTIIVEGNHTIIDVRPPQGIESQGAIPTAVNIPLDDVKNQIDNRSNDPDSILNGEGPFLFCCTGGVMSYMAAIHAQESGMKEIYNLEGGHSAWKMLKESQVTA